MNTSQGLGHHLPEQETTVTTSNHTSPPQPLPEDQVVRLRRFEAAYPEVDIERPDYAHGKTWWHARYEGRRLASDTNLRGLLDALEGLFSDDGGAR